MVPMLLVQVLGPEFVPVPKCYPAEDHGVVQVEPNPEEDSVDVLHLNLVLL